MYVNETARNTVKTPDFHRPTYPKRGMEIKKVLTPC